MDLKWNPEDFTSAPELKSIEKFRAALNGFGMPKRDKYKRIIKGQYDTLKVIKSNEKGAKWWKNFSLTGYVPKSEAQEHLPPTQETTQETAPEPAQDTSPTMPRAHNRER